IEQDATQVQAILRSDQIPPGRYTVTLSTRAGWRGIERRPGRVVPDTVLDVHKVAWPHMLRKPEDSEAWLLALRAHGDGVWHPPDSIPDPSEWNESQLAVLAQVLLQMADSLDPIVGRKLRRWSLDERLRLIKARTGAPIGVELRSGGNNTANL